MEQLFIKNQIYRLVAQVGDYGGEGSVGQANINTLNKRYSSLSQPFSSFNDDGTLAQVYSKGFWVEAPTAEYDDVDLVVLYSAYGSECAYLREDAKGADDVFSALSGYPLDDDELAAVEQDWIAAAIPDAVRDVGRAMRGKGLAEDVWEALDQAQAVSEIQAAISRGNGDEYSIEYSSAFIHADKVSDIIIAHWGDLVVHHAVKLPNGDFIDLGEAEPETDDEANALKELPTLDDYENAYIDVFEDLPQTTTEYAAEYQKRRHLK